MKKSSLVESVSDFDEGIEIEDSIAIITDSVYFNLMDSSRARRNYNLLKENQYISRS